MNGPEQEAINNLTHQGGVHWYLTGALLMLLADHVPDFKVRMIEMLHRIPSASPIEQSERDEAIRRVQSL